ncbi:hypothetical protein PG994_008885 [Apiospora phragmitis]|uniref:Uncharacterized protein n=1 Tax=Apiospora phragmitis TaxID=2905665 RepID=A0ABR1UHR1_9PEZI
MQKINGWAHPRPTSWEAWHLLRRLAASSDDGGSAWIEMCLGAQGVGVGSERLKVMRLCYSLGAGGGSLPIRVNPGAPIGGVGDSMALLPRCQSCKGPIRVRLPRPSRRLGLMATRLQRKASPLNLDNLSKASGGLYGGASFETIVTQGRRPIFSSASWHQPTNERLFALEHEALNISTPAKPSYASLLEDFGLPCSMQTIAPKTNQWNPSGFLLSVVLDTGNSNHAVSPEIYEIDTSQPPIPSSSRFEATCRTGKPWRDLGEDHDL